MKFELSMDPPGLLHTVYLSVRPVGTKQVRERDWGVLALQL